MTLLQEVADDLGIVTVERLALNATTRQWEPSGDTFSAALLDANVVEIYGMGAPVDTQTMHMYTDFTSAGEMPVSIKDRVLAEGAQWHIINATRIPTLQDEAGISYTIQRIT